MTLPAVARPSSVIYCAARSCDADVAPATNVIPDFNTASRHTNWRTLGIKQLNCHVLCCTDIAQITGARHVHSLKNRANFGVLNGNVAAGEINREIGLARNRINLVQVAG